MTTYITQEQANELFDRNCWPKQVFADWTNGIVLDRVTAKDFANAAIQAYRDSLVAGVVLPEPVGCGFVTKWTSGDTPATYKEGYAQVVGVDTYTADQLRQAIADDRAKQVPQYLCNGMRFKVANRNGEAMLPCLPDELAGRWVALVAAEDDCHLLAAAPGPKGAV
tara:strand:- start:8549 stop:9046 length:498 start_codon:yes stop_codon:yes gene_type:complete